MDIKNLFQSLNPFRPQPTQKPLPLNLYLPREALKVEMTAEAEAVPTIKETTTMDLDQLIAAMQAYKEANKDKEFSQADLKSAHDSGIAEGKQLAYDALKPQVDQLVGVLEGLKGG